MPDFRHSTLPRISAAEGQAEFLILAGQLHGVHQRLGQLAEAISSEPRSALAAALRGAATCVGSDLLQDAIETLQAAGQQTEDGARREQIQLVGLLAQLNSLA